MHAPTESKSAKQKAETWLLGPQKDKCWRQVPKSWIETLLLWQKTRGAGRQVRFVLCGCLQPQLGLSACSGSSEALTPCWITIVGTISLPRHIPPWTRPDNEDDGCCFSCVGLSPPVLCSCSRPLMILTAKWFLVCLYQHGDVCALLNVQPSRMSLLTLMTWLMAFCIITEFFPHSSVFFFWMSVLWTFDSCILHFFPAIHATFEKLFGDWVGDSFPRASAEMVAHHSDLFGNSKLHEWLNDLAAFFSSHLSVLFLSCCQSANPHLQNYYHYIEHRRRCFCFLPWSPLCQWFLSAVKVQMFLVLCYVMRFPTAVLGRVDFFSWEMTPPLYFLFRTFLIRLWGWWFVWGTLTELCRSTQDTAVRRLVKFERTLRRFQINLTQSVMMVLHVEVVLRVGVRIDRGYEWKMHFLSCFCLLQNLLARVLHISMNLHLLRIQCDTAVLRIFSRSFCEKRRRVQVRVGDLVELRCTQVPLVENGVWFLIELHTCPIRLVFPRISCFLPLFYWWVFQESDTLSVFWSCSAFLNRHAVLSRTVLHRCHVFLRTLSTSLSFWWSHLEDLLGMERQPNFLDELEDAQGFSLAIKCDTLWACWRLIVLIFFVRMTLLIDAIWRQLWTSSEHGFYPNQYLRVARAWHLHINASASFLVEKISVIGPVLLPGLALRSVCPSSTLLGLSVSPQGMLSIPALFLAGQEFPDLKDFCVIYNFTEWIDFFVCFSVRSSTTVFLVCWIGKQQFPSAVDLAFSACQVFPTWWCSCSKVTLRCLSTTVDTVSCTRSRQSGGLRDCWSENNWSCVSSTFKANLTALDKISTNA